MANLTTLAAISAYRGKAAGAAPASADLDALITALIPRASAAIEGYLERNVLSAAVTEVRNGTGGQAMLLAGDPVTAVSSLAIDGVPVPPAPAFGAPGWRLGGNILVLDGYCFTRGRANVVVTYTAGHATTPPDIEQACIETVLLMLERRAHLDVSSKSLAGETVSYITAELTPSAKLMLSGYRRVAPL